MGDIDGPGGDRSTREGAIRVLVVAAHPFRETDLGLDGIDDVHIVGLVRRRRDVSSTLDQVEFDVAVVDTTMSGRSARSVIAEVRERRPAAAILALTPDPPPVDQVARALREGADGFADVDLDAGEAEAAIRCVAGGGRWFPEPGVEHVLDQIGERVELSAADRRSRLVTIVLGLVPLAGVVAGLLSLLWRRYLGQIGVRPVDLAIEPGSRVVDVVFSLLSFIGFFGPFLFVGVWTDQLVEAGREHPALRPLTDRPWLLRVVLTVAVLGIMGLLLVFADLILALLVGPVVGIAVLAAVLDLRSELPELLRLRKVDVRRFAVGGTVIGFAALLVLGSEALIRGPGFDRQGVNGLLMHRLIGFRAQPVSYTDVGGDGSTREVLYLGGNADLYVFADPCDDDQIFFVSVGSARLENIEEIGCSEP